MLRKERPSGCELYCCQYLSMKNIKSIKKLGNGICLSYLTRLYNIGGLGIGKYVLT